MAELKTGTTIGGRDVMVEIDNHLTDDMPHIAVDTGVSPNVTYRYGIGVQNGVWGIVYEEVV